jgi:signal peptidase II
MNASPGRSGKLGSALIAAAVVVLDRLTKIAILHTFTSSDILPVIPGIFNIVHAENPGAAFSMLAEASPLVRKLVLIGLSTTVLVFVGILLWRTPKASGAAAIDDALMRWGLALVFGGAFGNLIDRVFRGTVTDFIQVFLGSYDFPAFNVADSAITIGAALLVIDLLRSRKAS